MDRVMTNYRGLTLLVDLNVDRFLYIGMIGLALLAGSYLSSL